MLQISTAKENINLLKLPGEFHYIFPFPFCHCPQLCRVTEHCSQGNLEIITNKEERNIKKRGKSNN